jgi:hypothetical protein
LALATQRPAIFLLILPTKSQFLEMKPPLYSNLNLSSLSGSAQAAEQASHEIGQAPETPGKRQRFLVSFRATHEQYLEMVLPSLVIFNLNAVSAQVTVGLRVVGVPVGGIVGVPVGAKGAAEGAGEGLIELVGASVGVSLGTTLGERLGPPLGFPVGVSLGTVLGLKLGY